MGILRKLFILWLLFLPSVAWGASCDVAATTYYVDYVGGSDANEGTSTSVPWQHCPGDRGGSWHDSQCTLKAGDKVIFKGDVTYVGGFSASVGGNADTDAGRIIYDGDSGDITLTGVSRWGSGTDKAKVDCNLSTVGCVGIAQDYLTFNNFEVYNMPDGTVGAYTLVATSYKKYVKITNNKIHGVGGPYYTTDWHVRGTCVSAYRSTENIEISNNTIYDCGNQAISVNIGSGGHDYYIHHNDISDGPGGRINFGIYFGIYSLLTTSGNINIYNNEIHDIKYYSTPGTSVSNAHLNFIWLQGGGSSTYPLDGINIYNNLIYNDGTAYASSGAIHLEPFYKFTNLRIYNNALKNINYTASIYLTIKSGNFGNVYIYNNSVYNPVAYGGIFALFSGGTGKYYDVVEIKNNVFETHCSSCTSATIQKSQVNTLTIDNNLWYIARSSGFACNGSSGTWTTWKTCTGQSEDNSIGVSTNPLFNDVSANGHDLTLQVDSPARGEGTASGQQSSTDFAGNAWWTPPSMGAYEYAEPTPDTDAPILSNLTPTGVIDYALTEQLSVVTNETATCRYHVSSTTWADMTQMSSTGGTTHTQTVNVATGANTFKVVCQDAIPNESTASTWSFTVVDPVIPEYVVTISYGGSESGAGVTSPVSGTYTYDEDTVATTTQTPNTNNTFAGWSGTCGCTGTGACAPTITADCTIIATWTADTEYFLFVTYPTNGELVTADTGYIECGRIDVACSDIYYSGTVTLTGICLNYFHKPTWGGDGIGTDTRAVTMTEDQTVTFECYPVSYGNTVNSGASKTMGNTTASGAGITIN